MRPEIREHREAVKRRDVAVVRLMRTASNIQRIAQILHEDLEIFLLLERALSDEGNVPGEQTDNPATVEQPA